MHTTLKRILSFVMIFALFVTMTFTATLSNTYAAAAKAPKSLTLKTQGAVKTVDVGGKLKVTVSKVKPKKASKKVSWKIVKGKKYVALSKKKATSVVVKGKKKGTATIQATSKSKKSVKDTITIKVKNLKAEKVTLNAKNLTVAPNKTATIKATVKAPQKYGYKNQKTKWKSSNTSVATVNAKGVVTGKKEGTAKITAKNDGKSATCTVTVKQTLSMAKDVNAYLKKANHQYAYDIAKTLAYDPKYLSNKELGWRTAGSDAEHKASDYLLGKMKELGLNNVEKVPVTVDKWQFNDASLTIEGTDVKMTPASYATNGTKQRGKADGITAEIVDVGVGSAKDYQGKDVKGKIVLAEVDQWNGSWIDSYMNEAYEQGAAAIVTYNATTGYAAYSEDMINMQDLCGEDLMPCVSISRNQAKKILAAIKDGHKTATLKVDNIMDEGKGISYNVIGKIPGRSHEQQIIVSGHYDVYFNGFQDDSCAIGLILAMAKGMKDSNYVPENDIVFVCHGSEEWGAIGSSSDWTTGAWEMVHTAHPEWAGKTLAMINFEMPAVYDGAEQLEIQCEPEFSSIVKNFVTNTGLLAEPSKKTFSKGISSTSLDSHCLEDGVSYRWHGIPHFINVPGFNKTKDANWNRQRYHTAADNTSTYSKEVMTANLNTFGTLAIYIDKTPALGLDLTATCDDLDEALDEVKAKGAGADVAAYKAGSKELRASVENLNKKISDINARYEKAAASGASQASLDKIRAEGRKVNLEKTLPAFKAVQDNFIGIMTASDPMIKHMLYHDNIDILPEVITALENNKPKDALDLAWQINGGTEFSYYDYSKKAADRSLAALRTGYFQGETDRSNIDHKNLFWTYNKGPVIADTSAATIALLNEATSANYATEIKTYQDALTAQKGELKKQMEKETSAMKDLAAELNK